MFGGGELARIEAGSHESAERDEPFGPAFVVGGMASAIPQRHVQQGVGPRDGITAGVHEAGGGVEFDQDVHKIVVEAGGVQLQRTGFGSRGQPAAHTVVAEPASLPGDETLDGLGEEELVAPAERLEEVRQRGRSGLWQANPDEVEPPGGQGSRHSSHSPPTAAIHALAPRPQRSDVGFIHRTFPRCHRRPRLWPTTLLAVDGGLPELGPNLLLDGCLGVRQQRLAERVIL